MYDYDEQKEFVFTDRGQRAFLKIRDHVAKLLSAAGAVRMGEAMSGAEAGDSWDRLACVNRLIELGEIREVERPGVAGQDRIFVSNRRN